MRGSALDEIEIMDELVDETAVAKNLLDGGDTGLDGDVTDEARHVKGT